MEKTKENKIKIGEVVLRKYTNSTIETEGFNGKLKDFFIEKNVNEKVLQWCDWETCISHAFGFDIILKYTGEWGNETYYNIIKK